VLQAAEPIVPKGLELLVDVGGEIVRGMNGTAGEPGHQLKHPGLVGARFDLDVLDPTLTTSYVARIVLALSALMILLFVFAPSPITNAAMAAAQSLF